MTHLYTLKWDDHQKHVTSTIHNMREDSDFFDVTLMGDDNCKIQAHKVILSAGSSSFRYILKGSNHSHPLIYMNGIKPKILNNVVSFIYEGKVEIPLEDVKEFLGIAKDMKIIGLGNVEFQASQNYISNEFVQENVFEDIRENILDSKDYNIVINLSEEEFKIELNCDTQEGWIKETQNMVENKNIDYFLQNGNKQLEVKINQRHKTWICSKGSGRGTSFKCESCGKMCNDNFVNNVKVRLAHMNRDKQILCTRTFCRLLFQTKDKKLTHTQSCFIMCKTENCEKQFTQESKYKAHVRGHLKPSNPTKTSNPTKALNVTKTKNATKTLNAITFTHIDMDKTVETLKSIWETINT